MHGLVHDTQHPATLTMFLCLFVFFWFEWRKKQKFRSENKLVHSIALNILKACFKSAQAVYTVSNCWLYQNNLQKMLCEEENWLCISNDFYAFRCYFPLCFFVYLFFKKNCGHSVVVRMRCDALYCVARRNDACSILK